MTRYLQIDLTDTILMVTGQLLSAGVLDVTTFPVNRRFINMGEDVTTLVPAGSTAVIENDDGAAIVMFGPNITIVPPPPPDPPPPDPTQFKLDKILALLQPE